MTETGATKQEQRTGWKKWWQIAKKIAWRGWKTFHNFKVKYHRFLRKYSPIRKIKVSPAWKLLLLIFIVAILFFIFWAVTGPALVEIGTLSETQWQGLEAITSVAVFALSIGAGFIVLMELLQNTDARNLEIYRDIYEKFMSDEQIKARRYIYNYVWVGRQYKGNFKDLAQMEQAELEEKYSDLFLQIRMSDTAQKHIKDVLNAMDYFGFLTERDWVTDAEIIGWLSPMVVKLWVKIGPSVIYECRKRPEEPDYYDAARKLAIRCQEWRKKNLPVHKDITFDDERL